MLTEILLSLDERSFEYFYREQKSLPESEFTHLSKHYDLSKIEKVIVVGAGAIPYTALFFSKEIKKPTFAVERNAISYFACLRLLHKLKANKIRVIRASGQLYHDYENSLVIISLHTRLKQEIFERVLANKNIVVIRQPLKENARIFESVDLSEMTCTTVEHEAPPLLSLFIANENVSDVDHRACSILRAKLRAA